MKADAYSTFVNMFLALDALWDDCRDETLGGFLSEANPYLWADKGSADPAIWSEFSAAYEKRFPSDDATLEQAHSFVHSYLEGISDEYSKVYPGHRHLSDAFLEIAPLDKWLSAYSPVED